ncbi:MAG: hypothetical protein ACODUE_11845 [Synechococcus sp.]
MTDAVFDPGRLRGDELFWLLSLAALLLLWPLRAADRRSPLAWVEPPMVLAVIFAYYSLAGPLLALASGGWIDRGVNFRGVLDVGLQTSVLAYGAFLVGYSLLPSPPARRLPPSPFDPDRAWRLGWILNGTGLALHGLTVGPLRLLQQLNPLVLATEVPGAAATELGPFANYAALAVNLLIPGTCLLLAARLRQPWRPLWPLLLWTFVAAALFTAIGFRYRLVLLLVPLLLLPALAGGRRPSLPLLAVAGALLLLASGAIGLTRQYGLGLDLSLLQGVGAGDVVQAGFGEAAIFFPSAALVQAVPDSIASVGAEPLLRTLLFPVPSVLLPGKESASYLLDALARLYGSAQASTGAAVLNWAEYALMAGWPGVVAGYGLLGLLYRRLWNGFLQRRSDPLVQVVTALALAYLYVVVSRGYLPQVVMLAVFTVLPPLLLLAPVADDRRPSAQQR